MRRPSRQLNIFSISTLDLFASAMGAFVIIAVILFPYYLKNDDMVAKARTISAQLEEAQKTAARYEAARNKAEAKAARHEAARKKAEAEAASLQPKDIEIVFVCDTTSSMKSHLDGIKDNLKDVVDILKMVNQRIRIGFVAYRDISEDGHPGTYVTRSFPIREMSPSSFQSLNQFVDSLQAASVNNNDAPESVSVALDQARGMSWSPGNWKHIIVVITDASAKNRERSLRLAADFNQQSSSNSSKVSTILARTKDMDPKAPEFLKALANSGRGDYIEDSGRMLNSLIRATLSP